MDVSSACDSEVVESKEMEWLTKKRRIAGLVNAVDISNIRRLAREILNENDLVEDRGLFCEAIMKSQKRFRHLSSVYAALVAVINAEFPEVGHLVVKRAVLKFKEAANMSCWNKKRKLVGISMLLAHLVNQRVVYEVLAEEVVLILLGNPTSENVEVAVKFCMECGSSLQAFDPRKFEDLVEELGGVLRESGAKKRVKIMFKDVERGKFGAMEDELELVDPVIQVTHQVSLLHDIDPETELDDINYLKINHEHLSDTDSTCSCIC